MSYTQQKDLFEILVFLGSSEEDALETICLMTEEV